MGQEKMDLRLQARAVLGLGNTGLTERRLGSQLQPTPFLVKFLGSNTQLLGQIMVG